MTKAANQLNVTQSTLSKSISKLEEDVGVPLFNRVKKRIYLNEAGRGFKTYVEAFFAELQQGQENGQRIRSRENNVTRIGCNTPWFIATCVREYLTEHTQYEIYYDHRTKSEIYNALKKGNYQFAIVNEPFNDPEMTWQPILSEDLYIASGVQLPTDENGDVTFSDMRDLNFFAGTEGSGWREFTDEIFKKAGYQPRVVFTNLEMPDYQNLLVPMNAATLMPSHLAIPFYYSKLMRANAGPYIYRIGDSFASINFGIVRNSKMELQEWQEDLLKFCMTTIRVSDRITRSSRI
jgi:DNA-binding transcriptional LysR family regulator